MMKIISERKKEIILSVVFAFGIFLILFHFTDTPKVWIDEGMFTETAKNLALHGVLGLQTQPGSFFPMNNFLLSTSYPVILPVVGSFILFGAGLWQARLPMIIFMFVLMLLFYFFAKKRYGFGAAIASMLMLFSFSPFYGNGRPVLGEVPGLVYLILGALTMLYWEENDFASDKWALIAGLALGLSASTKPIYLFVLTVSLVAVLLFWIRKIKNKRSLAILCTGFLVPVAGWVYINIPDLGSISKTISTYLYLAGNHESSLSITQTIFANLGRFFTESTPILFFFLFVVTALAYLVKLYKYKKLNPSISEVLISFFVILNWLVFLAGTGHYRYFFPAHILLYLIFPGAVWSLTKVVNRKRFNKVAVGAFTLLIVLQFVHLVFLSDTSFTEKRTRNHDLTISLSNIPSDQKIFIDMSPEATIFLKSSNYSQYLSMQNIFEAGSVSYFTDPSLQFILSRTDFQKEYGLKCFKKTEVDRYLLFEKIANCKK